MHSGQSFKYMLKKTIYHCVRYNLQGGWTALNKMDKITAEEMSISNMIYDRFMQPDNYLVALLFMMYLPIGCIYIPCLFCSIL